MKELKKWFKVAALEIRRAKYDRKTVRFNKDHYDSFTKKIEGLGGPVFTTSYLWSMQNEFRHRHIAYSLLRGRTIEQIESPAEDNKPSKKTIEKYLEEYSERFKALCINS